MQDIKESISQYYGQAVEKTEDLQFNACCVADYDAVHLEKLTDEVLERRYGCGSPIPEALDGRTVVDLGSGAGADCFIASQLVGQQGRVIGVDMTEEQLEIAQRNIEPHMERFGYDEPNIEFRKGVIEELPVADGAADVVISNCVINLSDDKEAVFSEIWRVLADGGEFYISDIVADRRIPARLQADDLLWNECLTGAAYTEDLRRTMKSAGFFDVRTVKSAPTGDVIEGIRFRSVILRGFKLDLEDRCEDYGQVAVYGGTIPGCEEAFVLDDHHRFVAGRALRVCRNTARMLSRSRFAEHFEVSQPLSHLGLFDCAPADGQQQESARNSAQADNASSGCC